MKLLTCQKNDFSPKNKLFSTNRRLFSDERSLFSDKSSLFFFEKSLRSEPKRLLFPYQTVIWIFIQVREVSQVRPIFVKSESRAHTISGMVWQAVISSSSSPRSSYAAWSRSAASCSRLPWSWRTSWRTQPSSSPATTAPARRWSVWPRPIQAPWRRPMVRTPTAPQRPRPWRPRPSAVRPSPAAAATAKEWLV